MLKLTLVIAGIISIYSIRGQDAAVKIRTAYTQFERNSQLRHAATSLTIIEIASGKTVFEKNGQMGLAPASCLKILTAVTALETLGRGFRYTTNFGYTGTVSEGTLNGNIILSGSGDPSFGSVRFAASNQKTICDSLKNRFSKLGIRQLNGRWLIDPDQNPEPLIARGWIWEDIGNYYGAGLSPVNWNENSYRVILRPGTKPGEPVTVMRTVPQNSLPVRNELVSGAKGSGDHAYIFFKPGTDSLIYRGSVPCCTDSFVIEGALTDPAGEALKALASCTGLKDGTTTTFPVSASFPLFTHHSPKLEQLLDPFLKKSINLYGEALLKQIGIKISSESETDAIKSVQDFWQKQGIPPAALQIMDGSGLSPGNRITTDALARILFFAKKKTWFSAFHDALPVINGMRMKSGLIEGVRSYAGYLKSKSGKEYCFAIIINNYNGSSAPMTQAIFSLLNQLSRQLLD